MPKIHVHVTSDDPSPLSTFIILEYIGGEKLSYTRMRQLTAMEKEVLYSSLADIYIQLRRLEFPSIGRLVHRHGDFHVGLKTSSIDFNMQQLEGLGTSSIQDGYLGHQGTLASANKYVDMLLDITYNAFLRCRSSVVERGMGGQDLYHQHIFRNHVRERWIDTTLDQGPFVLAHGDLEPFNLIVDDSMAVISVLDWEWSRVVPVQFFNPPWWLCGLSTTRLASKAVYDGYLATFLHDFLQVVRAREQQRFGNERLADEWHKSRDGGGFLISNALENWTDIDWVASGYVARSLSPVQGHLSARVAAYLKQDLLRAFVADVKERDGLAYCDELNRLVQETESEEQALAPVEELTTSKWIFTSLFTSLPWSTRAIPWPTRAISVTGLSKAAVIFAATSLLIWRLMPDSLFRPRI